jgi:hypothetical protein
MRPDFNMVGQRFGRLTVLSHAGVLSNREHAWLCRCDCGREKVVRGGALRGKTQSCGCLRLEVSRIVIEKLHQVKHGMCKSPEHYSWSAMIDRCTNPGRWHFKHYGGAGVEVCDRWRGEHGFENFYADMGPRIAGTTLGRFGDVGNYEPRNCKWMTKDEQVATQVAKRKAVTLAAVA